MSRQIFSGFISGQADIFCFEKGTFKMQVLNGFSVLYDVEFVCGKDIFGLEVLLFFVVGLDSIDVSSMHYKDGWCVTSFWDTSRKRAALKPPAHPCIGRDLAGRSGPV